MINWPENKRFTFTVFDDTDLATLENVRPVYDLLTDLGFRTTKSVWPIAGSGTPSYGGATCEDPSYVAWLKVLQGAGFEIGFHMATYHSSKRAETKRALDRFEEVFGHNPISMANHSKNRENIYWGRHRLSGLNRLIYQILSSSEGSHFEGEASRSEYFWGDYCKERVQYARNFVFHDINTLKQCPMMPYHDNTKPFVKHWFASSEGSNVESFTRMLGEQNQDQLEAEGGACIMYTHFGDRFCIDGKLDGKFQQVMERLAKRNGWFVPVSTLLDYLKSQRGGGRTLTTLQRYQLEWRWLWDKVRGHLS